MSQLRYTIGERIRQLRNEQGLTLLQLAMKCGIPKTTIQRVEVGTYSPKFETVEIILNSLGRELTEQEPRK